MPYNYTLQLLRFIFILSVLSIISACNWGNLIPKDESILTQTPCNFPCWHGITPGQSTIADVQQLIKTDPFIASSPHLSQAADGTGRIGIQWSYNGFNINNRILYENGVVYSISISPNIPFSLQDIISKYGEPAAVNASLADSMEGGVVDAVLALYYPQIGLQVGFPIKGGSVITTNQFSIEPSIQGASFTLVTPKSSLRDFIAEIYPLQDDELNQVLANMTLGWPGFNSLLVVNMNRNTFYDATFIVTATPSP